jgi:hypothetical protein
MKGIKTMDITKIRLSSQQVLGDDTAIMIEQKPLYAYKNNVRLDEQIGMTFDVLAFQNGSMDKVSVKVEGATAFNVSQDELIEANKTLNFYFIKFSGFEAKPYNSSNSKTMLLSCSAKSAEMVRREDLEIIDL